MMNFYSNYTTKLSERYPKKNEDMCQSIEITNYKYYWVYFGFTNIKQIKQSYNIMIEKFETESSSVIIYNHIESHIYWLNYYKQPIQPSLRILEKLFKFRKLKE